MPMPSEPPSRLRLALLALATTLSLSACANGSGNYCEMAAPIYPNERDVITPETGRQILRENEKWYALCR